MALGQSQGGACFESQGKVAEHLRPRSADIGRRLGIVHGHFNNDRQFRRPAPR